MKHKKACPKFEHANDYMMYDNKRYATDTSTSNFSTSGFGFFV